MEIWEMSLVMGMMLSVFLTLGFYVLRGIFYVPFIRRRLVETAEREGHMVQARLLRQREVYEEHTRCSRDWSSDVCSSDLIPVRVPRENVPLQLYHKGKRPGGADAVLPELPAESLPVP